MDMTAAVAMIAPMATAATFEKSTPLPCQLVWAFSRVFTLRCDCSGPFHGVRTRRGVVRGGGAPTAPGSGNRHHAECSLTCPMHIYISVGNASLLHEGDQLVS